MLETNAPRTFAIRIRATPSTSEFLQEKPTPHGSIVDLLLWIYCCGSTVVGLQSHPRTPSTTTTLSLRDAPKISELACASQPQLDIQGTAPLRELVLSRAAVRPRIYPPLRLRPSIALT